MVRVHSTQPLTVEAQVEVLERQGMLIEDPGCAMDLLRNISYTEFREYARQFRDGNRRFVSGTTFQQIAYIYAFDEALRNVLFPRLLTLERLFRTTIGQEYAFLKCHEPPFLEHYRLENYTSIEPLETLIRVTKSIGAGPLPMWDLARQMSFHALSHFFGGLHHADQDIIADALGTSPKILESVLRGLPRLRNRCAHGSRLYNVHDWPGIRLPRRFRKRHKNVQSNTVFGYVLVILRFLPTEDEKARFVGELLAVISKYQGVVDLKGIGFPDNGTEILEERLASADG